MAFLNWRSSQTEMQQTPMSHHTVVTWEKGHVRTAVLKLTEGSGEILGLASAPVQGIGKTSQPDVDRWYASCDRALTQAEDMTLRLAGHKVVPDHVTMTIPSKVTRSLAVVDQVRRRNARKAVTLDELSDLLKRGYRKAQDRLDVRARGRKEDIICGSLAHLSLDGQPVTDPLGLVGDQLQLHLFFCLAPIEWIRTLEIIAERLGLEIATILPHYMAYASPLSDTASLLMLVEDSLTVVNLVRRGRVEWAATIPQGSEALIASTVEDLSVPDHQIDALMRAYRAGQLREDVELRMSKNYWIALRRWMGIMADQIRKNSQESFFPYHIYSHDVTGRVPEVRPALETPYWEQRLPFTRCPKIDRIDANGIHNVLDCTAQADGLANILLRSAAHYVARLYAPGNELDRALVDTIHWHHHV